MACKGHAINTTILAVLSLFATVVACQKRFFESDPAIDDPGGNVGRFVY